MNSVVKVAPLHSCFHKSRWVWGCESCGGQLETCMAKQDLISDDSKENLLN